MDAAQQQIVDSIKSTSNILVTVSTNPSVDELSAALGLTLLLDKMDKRATAVFSGNVPPAIKFLEPGKTFEDSADSLRDFIIALDKEKADHLRYKVDGDVVKIFITPYKTTLSEKDLEFSQGDYNVELVVALGVSDQEHLDKALDAHGKILHDAKVVTVTVGDTESKLGGADWHNKDVSSLSEMIVSLADQLKGSDPLLDEQISTALLTGIVSATDRFSNNHTSSQTMTMAAQLMAAGANQQLIAAKLEEAHDIAPGKSSGDDNSSKGSHKDTGSELVIKREDNKDGEQPQEKKLEPLPKKSPEPATPAEDADQMELEKQLAGLSTPSEGGGTLADMEKELKQAASEQLAATETPPAPATDGNLPGVPDFVETPRAEAKTETSDSSQSDMIQNHDQTSPILPEDTPPINSIQADSDEEPMVDPFNMPATSHEGASIAPTDLGGTTEGAVLLATAPAESSQSPDATPPPVMTPAQAIDPEIPELPPLPPLPPLPSDANVPPLPPPPPPPPVFNDNGSPMPAGAVSGDIFGDGNNSTPTETPPAAEPGQFKIPGSP